MTQTISTQKNLQVLYQHGALAAGSDLWVIPELNTSRWSQTLDWYVNFQISRAKNHHAKELSSELKSIINDNELEVLQFNSPKTSLMIASDGRLPNKQLVELTSSEKPEEWVLQVFQIWQQLQRPSLRIFLPEFITSEDLFKLWPEKENVKNITVVPNQGD